MDRDVKGVGALHALTSVVTISTRCPALNARSSVGLSVLTVATGFRALRGARRRLFRMQIRRATCRHIFLIHSSKAGPRGNRPGTMLQASAFASMIVTFGSPEIGTRSLVAPPCTGPAVPK